MDKPNTKSNKSTIENLMKELINTAHGVIDEVNKENPDHIKICDLGIEKIDELREQIFSAILGNSTVIN